MRRTLWLPTLLACLLGAAHADAGPILYNTTDLGVDQWKTPNADGSYSGIANTAGTTTYAFSKVPVTPIDIQVVPPYPSDGIFSQTHLTMQVGAYQVGTKEVSASPLGTLVVPSFQTPTNLSFASSRMDINDAWIAPGGEDPVRDLNVQGQAVGVGVLQPGTQSRATFAAFSALGLVGHGGYAPTVDNLNSYITPLADGITLTTAFKIDDLGRILAVGSDNHDYMLTPVALGDAATVPEPTTLATLGVLGMALWIRVRSRQSRVEQRSTSC